MECQHSSNLAQNIILGDLPEEKNPIKQHCTSVGYLNKYVAILQSYGHQSTIVSITYTMNTYASRSASIQHPRPLLGNQAEPTIT
jgi:hypothetical protein